MYLFAKKVINTLFLMKMHASEIPLTIEAEMQFIPSW